MKEAIVYFTFGGSTKKEAERLASERHVPAFRVYETRGRSLSGAFIPGGFQAIKRRCVPIRPIGADLREYDRITIGCPVWGGYPAPAFNSILALVPEGREVEVFLCSGGGDTEKSRDGTISMIRGRKCRAVSYRDVATNVKPGRMKE